MKNYKSNDKTYFMNQRTFSEDEIKNYPYDERKTFVIWFDSSIEAEPVEVYATDKENLFLYLKDVYNTEFITNISEKHTIYTEIEMPEDF